MTVLVLGESGQLAAHLKELLPTALFRGRNTLDLADTAAASSEPDVLVAASDSVADTSESLTAGEAVASDLVGPAGVAVWCRQRFDFAAH